MSRHDALTAIYWGTGIAGAVLAVLLVALNVAHQRQRRKAGYQAARSEAEHFDRLKQIFPGSVREFPPPSWDPYVVDNPATQQQGE